MEEPRLTEEIAFPVTPQNSLTDALIILEGTIDGFRSRLRKSRASLVGFSGEIYHLLGLIDPRVTMGESGRNKTVLLEFAIVKCRSPYNVILERTGMRSIRAIGSTIHSMIKFPTANRVAALKTSREALRECR
ncbi:hypothetical protein Tco_1200443 [Tanacetum coccineum]